MTLGGGTLRRPSGHPMRYFVVLLLASACGPRPDPAAQGPAPIAGTVERVDLSPMAYDGDAELTLRTDQGERVEVRVPARMGLCEAAGLNVVGRLEIGDRVEVVGEWSENGTIRPCTSPEHRLVRPGFAEGTYEGVYVSGFETSSFTPCGETDVHWWVHPSDDLVARYNAIRGEQAGRGLGPHVRLVLEGDLSPEGEYGHLGASPRALTVTRVMAMEYLAPGDGEWPTIACE